jgi:hypothetical protein
LSRRIGRALQETAPLWPDIKRAFGWVHRAAHILNNTEALPAPTVARWPVWRPVPTPRVRRRLGRRRRPLLESNPQLPARPVPLPCRRRPAGHQQRAGRLVRFLPLLPAAHHRQTLGFLGDRGARPGAPGRLGDLTPRTAGRQRSGRCRSDPLASDAHRHHSTPAATNQRKPLQTRSGSLFAQAGSSICRRQVSFAVLVFLNASWAAGSALGWIGRGLR